MEQKEKVLIFNVNWLGDVLFSTAAIRAIRQNYPDSYIACILLPRVYEIVKDNPNLNEVIIYDEGGQHKGFLGKLRLIKLLRQKKFNRVFLFHRSFSRALICFLAGIPERIGYNTKGRGFLLTQKIRHPAVNSLHRVDYFLNILESAGLKLAGREYDFFITEKSRAYVKMLLYKYGVTKDDFSVLIHPSGNWGPKRWPKENFAALVKKLINELKAKVIISGTQDDLNLANEISRLAREDLIILCGKINIAQLGALMQEVSLVISADSGPLHLAAAVGTDTIALFGPTSKYITGPITKARSIILDAGIECKVPCYDLKCADNRCMKEINPEEVLNAVKQIKSR